MRRTGPLGALPRLSSVARRALAGCAVLAALGGAALVGQAWALASVLANVVAGAPPGGPLGVLAGAVLARAILGWATQVVAARAAAGAKEELRARLLDRALALGPEWIVANGPAKLTTLATKGLDALDAYFTVYLPALVQAAVLPLGIVGVILLADWPSALVVAVTLPLVPLFAALVGLRTRDRVAEATATEHRLAGHLFELVRALPVLTAFGRAAVQADTVHRLSEAQRRTTMATLRLAFASALALELIATLSVALVAVLVGLRLIAGDLGLGIGLFVLILAPECYLPLRAAGAAHHASEEGMEAVRRVADIPAPPPRPTKPAHGELRVTNLKVRRRNGFAPNGVSFVARPGEIVHLNSPSGTGKSTTFAALLGFVAPTTGTIRMGDTTLAEADPDTWRRQIAWVPQSPRFTGATVAEELALAVSDYPHPDQLSTGKIHNANLSPPADRMARRDAPGNGWGLRSGRARSGIAGLGAVAARVGVDHLLGRGVDGLSTGERQRVAVGRALLRVDHGATLLLLDEPTAHLDPAAAGQVMAAVHDAAAAGVAVVLASHRAARPEPVVAHDRRRDGAAGGEPPPRRPLRDLMSSRLLAGAALGAVALLAGVALTATSAWLIAKASTHPPVLTLSVAVVGVRAFGLARAGLRYAERVVTHDAAFRTAGDLHVRLWRALMPAHRVDFHKLTNDIDTVRDLTPRVLLPPLVAALVCVAAAAAQLAILPAAGLALVIAVAAAGLGAPAVALALDRRATRMLAAGRRRVAASVLTLLDAAPDLIACGAHRACRAALAEADADLAARARRQAFGAGAATALITLATGAAAVAGVWLAAGRVDPLLVPVLALVPLALVEPLALLPPAALQLEPLRAAHTQMPAGTYARPAAGGITLRDVDVRWPGASEPALRGVTLDVPRGAHVAVVGPSGAGKSTLLAFLLGFLPAERGTATLPARAGWCPQEPHLVATTLRENLRIAEPAATAERMRDALRQAEIEDWAGRLDTDPTTASGGEAQRLALARALLADADLLLLDEPTAHLDVPTARRVLRNLRATGRTVVHITHRVEEVAGADVILEVDGGRVRATALA